MVTKCENCGNKYEQIGKHWSQSSICEYPKISEYQLNVINGLLYGDAAINKQKSCWNARLDLKVQNRYFAQEVSEELSWLSKSESENKSKYNNISNWRITTFSHPKFNDLYNEWYPNGEKIYPIEEVNSTILRYWYLGDGSLGYTTSGNTPYARLTANSQTDERLKRIADKIPFRATASSGEIRISTRDTKGFLLWIGEELEGYENKWI